MNDQIHDQKNWNSRHDVLEAFFDINKRADDIISKWRSGNRDILEKSSEKESKEVFTNADVLIEREAKAILSAKFDGIPVIGEEESFRPPMEENYQNFFVIDPIDGTKQFIKGEKEWSISLAAVENGKVAVSSIYMPDRHENYSAILGGGLKLNEKPYPNRHQKTGLIGVGPVQVGDARLEEAVLRTGLSPKPIPAFTPKIAALLRGDIDAAIFLDIKGMVSSLWDYAAAVLLIQEFGGNITSVRGDELPLDPGNVTYRDGWLASYKSALHEQLLKCLNGY